MSAISELVAFLVSTGIPPESLAQAVNLAQLHATETVEFHRNSTGIPPENGAERRRAWDRERKRKIAESRKTDNIDIDSSSSKKESIQGKKDSKEEDTRAKKPKLIPIPPDWKVPETAYRIGAEINVDVHAAERKFRDYVQSSGKRYACYDAAFRNFVRNQPNFTKQLQTTLGPKWNGLEGVV